MMRPLRLTENDKAVLSEYCSNSTLQAIANTYLSADTAEFYEGFSSALVFAVGLINRCENKEMTIELINAVVQEALKRTK